MNFITRFLDKQKDPEAFKSKEFLRRTGEITAPQVPVADKEEYHFKHSGNCGDIIYAMPVMLAIAKGRPVHLHLNTGQKVNYGRNIHPLGNVMLNDAMVKMLRPLILHQPGFVHCDSWKGEAIDVDLDYIRKFPFLLNRGNIARWYFLVFGEYYELSQPWLQALPNNQLKDTILIARSQRYHAPGVSYDFLRTFADVRFIGVEPEFAEMKKMIPGLQYAPVNDFLEMASLVAGARLFIGNQSFPFAIAEALKMNRLLEWYFQTPNVNVEGRNGFDFCFQPNFEKMVHERYHNDK